MAAKEHYYRFTYINSDNDETGPSKAISFHDPDGDATDLILDNIPRNMLVDIAHRAIYRSTTETVGATPATSTYKALTTVAGNDYATFTDNLNSVSGNVAMGTDEAYINVSNAQMSIVAPGTINDGNGSITEMPTSYYRAVILIAATRLIQNKLTTYWADTDISTALGKITTSIARVQSEVYNIENYSSSESRFKEVDDALEKAQNLIDGATMGGDSEPESAQFHLKEEDPELVSSTLQTASQELARANTWLSQYTSMGSQFLSEAQAHIQEVQSRMGKSAQEYQWLQSQLAMCKQEYMDFFTTGVATDET